MRNMSFKPVVPDPPGGLADALHSYRRHVVSVALSATAAFFSLVYAGERYWPEQSSRFLWLAVPIRAHPVLSGRGDRFLIASYAVFVRQAAHGATTQSHCSGLVLRRRAPVS